MLAGAKMNWLRIDLPKAHLWSRQICHDCEPLAGAFRGRAETLNNLGVIKKIAVGKIEPSDTDPGLDKPGQHLGRFRGRPDGGDNLGLVRPQRRLHDPLKKEWA